MKYIGENAIKKLISLIKGDLATKQDSIAATGVLERDTTGVINGVETVGATLVETQEAKLVDVPNGLLKGDGTTISAAVAGTDYVVPSTALNELPGHIANGDIHVTAEQKTAWNGSVRYDAAQTLTDAQKAQARGNIAAAPDGFGLGLQNVVLTSSDDLDNVTGNGWYYWSYPTPANAPALINANTQPAYCAMLMIDSSQIVVSNNDRNNMAMRTENIDGWTPWEYLNPSMQLGVEYRTTERYNGKPVYAKLVDCGVFSDAGTSKTVQFDTSGTIDRIVDFGASTSDSWSLPTHLYGGGYDDATSIVLVEARAGAGNGFFYLYSKTRDMTADTVYAWAKYTKTTD